MKKKALAAALTFTALDLFSPAFAAEFDSIDGAFTFSEDTVVTVPAANLNFLAYAIRAGAGTTISGAPDLVITLKNDRGTGNNLYTYGIYAENGGTVDLSSAQIIAGDDGGGSGTGTVELGDRVGYARDALDKVCAASGCSWSVQSNTLQIILNSGTTNQEAYILAADSGLIESPERIIKSPRRASKTTSKKSKKTKKKEKYQKQAGWRVKSLLLPAVIPGDLVRVESITISGWFKVESLHHRGGSHDSEFYTEMELIEVLIDE